MPLRFIVSETTEVSWRDITVTSVNSSRSTSTVFDDGVHIKNNGYFIFQLLAGGYFDKKIHYTGSLSGLEVFPLHGS